MLDNAARVDSIVEERYQKNRDAIVLLSKSDAEVIAALSAGGINVTKLSSCSQVGIN